MDVMGPVKRFDRFQQRHRSLAIPLAVVRKFGNDQAGNLAALVAYYAFFSLFPLLLVFVTVLGFVLQGDPSAQASVQNTLLHNFPAANDYLKPRALHGHVLVLLLGLATSLWSGLGVTGAAQNALDTVWAVPMKDRPNFIQSKLRGVGLLLAIGVLFLIATGASGIVSGGFGGPLTKALGILVSFVANIALFFASFRLMTSKTIETHSLRVGVLVAAFLWTILQIFGGVYIGHVEKHISTSYASIAFVLALLVWLHLGAQMTLYAAELNTVLERRLWPRTLFGPPTAPADQETLTALAKVEERHDEEQVDVSFEGEAEEEARTAGPSPDA